MDQGACVVFITLLLPELSDATSLISIATIAPLKIMMPLTPNRIILDSSVGIRSANRLAPPSGTILRGVGGAGVSALVYFPFVSVYTSVCEHQCL
jgi:hypothetical protein